LNPPNHRLPELSGGVRRRIQKFCGCHGRFDRRGLASGETQTQVILRDYRPREQTPFSLEMVTLAATGRILCSEISHAVAFGSLVTPTGAGDFGMKWRQVSVSFLMQRKAMQIPSLVPELFRPG